MIDEMSSVFTDMAPGIANGVPQLLSLVVDRLTQIDPSASHVAHSCPVESLAITIVSVRTEAMVAGKPASIE